MLKAKSQFHQVTAAQVREAITESDNPVAVEIARLIAGYMQEAQAFIRTNGHAPDLLAHVEPSCPVEFAAAVLATEAIRETVAKASH